MLTETWITNAIYIAFIYDYMNILLDQHIQYQMAISHQKRCYLHVYTIIIDSLFWSVVERNMSATENLLTRVRAWSCARQTTPTLTKSSRRIVTISEKMSVSRDC